MVTQNTGFTIHNFNLRAEGGYDARGGKALVLAARLGLHYENFAIANVTDLTKNNAKLPSEVFSGPTLGAAVTVGKLTDSLGLRVVLDTMLVGASRTQTKNLEDGSTPSSKALWLDAALTYRWRPGLALVGSYALAYATTDFGAPLASSQRGHTGTAVSRTDIYHTLTFGIAKAF
jgi:hypothetical protein